MAQKIGGKKKKASNLKRKHHSSTGQQILRQEKGKEGDSNRHVEEDVLSRGLKKTTATSTAAVWPAHVTIEGKKSKTLQPLKSSNSDEDRNWRHGESTSRGKKKRGKGGTASGKAGSVVYKEREKNSSAIPEIRSKRSRREKVRSGGLITSRVQDQRRGES